MTEETKTPSIYEKVVKIQNEISVKKDWNNPFYKSKYITLDNIMDKLQPLLDKEKLVIFNMNIPWWVKTIVTDLTDTIVSEFTVNDITDPQQLWKVITYWRRYNLTSIFNILADEDDYISKVKSKYKMTKQQETDLRLCYQNAVKSNDSLPFE